MPEKKYKANNLVNLLFEIAEDSASNTDKVSGTHLLYACTQILLMPRPDLLTEVGGDRERNTRVLSALTIAEENLGDGKQLNIQALNELLRAYLPEIERQGIVGYYMTFKTTIWEEYLKKRCRTVRKSRKFSHSPGFRRYCLRFMAQGTILINEKIPASRYLWRCRINLPTQFFFTRTFSKVLQRIWALSLPQQTCEGSPERTWQNVRES